MTPADSVNDIREPSEPSYTPVAVCTGTDLDGNPITLSDRLCINREGIAVIMAEANSNKQQLEKCESQRSVEPKSSLFPYVAIAVLGIIIVLCVRWIGKLGSR